MRAALFYLFGLTVFGPGSKELSAAGVPLANVHLVASGGVHLETMGAPGMVYSLQRSSELQTWRTVDFARADAVQVAFEDDPPAGAGTRFYRVRLEVPRALGVVTNYHGWTNSILLSNGQVEAAIVPAVGRIMQFRFLNQATGPFWENAALAGKAPAANAWETTGSYGGDKVWPAPQSVWNWPPPRGFDSLSYTGRVTGGEVTLTGPVDGTFGIRIVREISIHPSEPMMRVTSRFEKVGGKTNEVGVWVVTQVKEAERVFVPIPQDSVFSKGYTALGAVPKGLVLTNGLVSLARDPESGTKIGNDASALLWVGHDQVLLIESPRNAQIPKTGYPDGGCSAEVYTNPNPTSYIELELLGPLAQLGPNQTLSATSLYTLFPRTLINSVDQAARILGR